MRTSILIALLLAGTIAVSPAQEKEKSRQRQSSKQGWLGVGIQDVTPKFAREEELKIKEGAYINDIVDDSPADSAGMKEGDVIVEFNGAAIEAAEDLRDAVRDTKPGSKATVKINRKGESKTLSVIVGRNKMRRPFAVIAPRGPRVMVNMFGGDIEGMELMELNKQLAEYFDVPGGKGVLVKNVEKDANASVAGVKAGDVIIKIGNDAIADIDDVHDAVSEAEEGEKVSVELLRKGKKVNVSIEISEESGQFGDTYWKHRVPGNFNFHFEPHMEQLENEIELRMRELPRKHKEMIKLESKMRSKEI